MLVSDHSADWSSIPAVRPASTPAFGCPARGQRTFGLSTCHPGSLQLEPCYKTTTDDDVPQPPSLPLCCTLNPHSDYAKMKRPESPRSSGDDVTATSGNTSSEDPPFSHGFLDNDPGTASGRPLYFKVVGGTIFLVLTYVIWGVLPIYWASVFKLYEHAHNLQGWIVVSIRSVSTLCF